MEIQMDESVRIGIRSSDDGQATVLADYCSGEMTLYALDHKQAVAQVLQDVAQYFGYDAVIDLCSNE